MAESSGSSCSDSLDQSGTIQLKSLLFRCTKIEWEIERFSQAFSFDKFIRDDDDHGPHVIYGIYGPSNRRGRSSRSQTILSPLFTSLCGNVWQIEVSGKELIGIDATSVIRANMKIKVSIKDKKTEGRCQYYVSFAPSIINDHDKNKRYDELYKGKRSEIPTNIFKPRLSGLNYLQFRDDSPAVKDNPTGNVTLYLRVQEEVEPVHTLTQLAPDTASVSNKLPNDIGTLLDNGEHSDVMLVVGDSKFKAHKLILSARSPVFKAMFSSDMQESSSNIIEINDLDTGTVQEMLKFMYTGAISDIEESKNTEMLLYAAEKYQLEQLKQFCSIQLSKNINADNAINLLIKSHLLRMKILKKQCIDFIFTYDLSEFMEREDWAKVEQYPELYKDMMIFCAPLLRNQRRNSDTAHSTVPVTL